VESRVRVIVKAQIEKARGEVLFSLFVWYLLYVIIDVVTTIWLIQHSPLGISGERDPLAMAYYQSFGTIGLLIGKILFFMPCAFAAVTMDAYYKRVPWFKEVTETVVLGLIGYTLIVILNNILAIAETALAAGELELLASLLARTIGLGSLLIATVLAYGTARIVGMKDNYRILEVAMGTAIIVGPLFLWKGALTETFSAHPLTLLAYVGAMFVFVAVAIYMLDEFKRQADFGRRVA
jgi:hypothetical protein